MTGTIINIITVLVGGGLGLLFGSRIPERLKQTVVSGMGLFTASMGLQMFFKTTNPLIVLGSLLIGILLGEWWQIEDGKLILQHNRKAFDLFNKELKENVVKADQNWPGLVEKNGAVGRPLVHVDKAGVAFTADPVTFAGR